MQRKVPKILPAVVYLNMYDITAPAMGAKLRKINSNVSGICSQVAISKALLWFVADFIHVFKFYLIGTREIA